MTEIRDVNSLPIAPATIETLLKHGYRLVQDLLNSSPIDLSKECEISLEDAVSVLDACNACRFLLAEQGIFTAKDLIFKATQQRPVITFCKEIDMMLGGGIPIAQLTEICGVPGIGKTQLGIQLALNVQIPEVFQGCGGRAIYIDTEGSFLPERVVEMAQELAQHLQRLWKHNANQPSQRLKTSEDLLRQQRLAVEQMTVEYLLSNISVYRCFNQSEFVAVLHQVKTQLLSDRSRSLESEERPVKLIVIDSIAFPFRGNLTDIQARNRLLSQLMQSLNEIAFSRQLAVVLMNHMTTKISKISSSEATNPTQKLVPALGEQFAHAIANRLLLHQETAGLSSETTWERKASLLKSASMPCKTVSFMVSQKGIRDFHLPVSTSSQTNATSTSLLDKRQRLL